jgi:ParB family chromosome partitioning protein
VAGQKDAYEIIAGERRWRAAQKAQLHEVPVVVRNLDEVESLQLALIENLQRTDLSAIDEANGYRRLIDFKHTQEDIGRLMGKSRPHIANTLRLLDLPPGVQELVQQGTISAGQGRALLAFDDPAAMAMRAVEEKLTVRDLERLAKGETLKAAPKGKKAEAGQKTADTRVLEKRLEEALGLKASLSLRGIGEQSLLTLEIRDFDQLDVVVDRLTRR